MRVPERILIDGRSGSGKSELARNLTAALGATLIRLDDFYPGWDGLRAGTDILLHSVLAAPRPGYFRWDWTRSAPGDWRDLDPTADWVIEGCGSLSRQTVAYATVSVWVECDDRIRKARALTRDGEMYAPHWERWAAQEDAFIAEENPRALADVIVAG